MRPTLHPSKRVFYWRRCARSLLIVLVLLSLLNVPYASAFGLASVSISDASVVEGDSGSVKMVFTVTRTGDTTSTVVVGYTTTDGTSLAGTDYTAKTGTVTIPSGRTSATISIPVIGNTIVQEDRSFSVKLTGVVNTYGPAITGFRQQTFGTGNNPFAVAVGDYNGDGKPDLASANSGSDTISVLLNTTAPGAAAPAFAPQQAFGTGDGPRSVAVGDFNGDGRPDLASANGIVSVLLNTTVPGAAALSFTPQQAFGTGGGSCAVAVGDFNGDGRLDLASANVGSSNISVLLNTTAPGAAVLSFAPQQAFGTGTSPLSVAVGDFNGDGKPDLASANVNSNTVSVLLNTTAPGAAAPIFAPQQAFATGTDPQSVAVGDFNGDGKPDLASANGSADTASVLLNTTAPGAAAPTFASQQTFGTGAWPQSVAVGDFNGDGKPDLASANWGSQNGSVLLNTTAPGAAAPAFASQQAFGTGDGSFAAAVGDFNGDGKPDLAVANTGASNGSVLLNTTTPGATAPAFAPQKTISTGTSPYDVAVGDFNGDGKLDLAMTNYNSGTISVLLNTTTPGAAEPAFPNQHTFATGINPISVAVGDFNGDGRTDLAIANNGSDTISVLLNTTAPGADTPAFANQQAISTGNNPYAVAVGDFNGDGKLDLASANWGSSNVSVLLNTTALGAATPDFAPQQTFGAGGSFAVAVGDFNGDGKLDLAIANGITNTVSVLLNSTAPGAAAPAFTPQQSFGTGGWPQSVAVGDFNGDGKVDLVIANNTSRNVSVLLNMTAPGAAAPAFARQQTFGTGGEPISVAVGDFNGDGKFDLVSANGGSRTVSVLLNLVTALTSNTAAGTIMDDDAPASITKAAGDHQLTSIHTAFPTPLAVEVKNGAGHLVQGASITFAAPSSGASGTFASSATVTTGAAGRVTAPVFTANGETGAYQVTASAAGVDLPAQFSLANIKAISRADLQLSASSVAPSQPVTLTATVTQVGAAAETITGTVTFLEGSTVLGTAELVDTGSGFAAQLIVSDLAVGEHSLRASYGGSDNYEPSSSNVSILTIQNQRIYLPTIIK